MIDTLKRFTRESLFSATTALLEKLHIQFDRETAERMSIADFWDGPMPQYLRDAQECIDATYFIGIVNDGSLQGNKNADSLESVSEALHHGGKYDGMFIFAVDAKSDANLTRNVTSALTRAFNRIASANPVILFTRQGSMLSISTCERMEYSQLWRKGGGEKLGKVNILRNINCEHPHRGHVDILDTLGERQYASFDELYKHWLETFTNELLTKKFYNELSDWYAWAVQIAKFPNDIHTDADDAKYNHESCIRLITRLIFVWFLKQKHLIPDEFFDEDYIRQNIITNFDPHNRRNLLYNAEESKYYRLVLQNLFFAMLNCPIVAEGKSTPNNRRFRGDGQQGYKRDGYNVNNLMRYKSEFMEDGADKFVKLANSSVPFLNGGLFDCLDDKPRGLYYDGFSERAESLAQLSLPDYLFFGDEVGRSIDLSEWYGDKNKKKVSARGLIDILKRYSFTIEENTPYDQEVSLDPELLGKVFENLLAAFNPETQTSARKQTGSFYTPREIVQYMVDESLVAHLKRMCGDEQESLFRSLVSYATEDVELTDQQRTDIMHALYNCRVLDPACGSGAFPMGVLQQMVHVLKRIDPSNEMWNSMMIDIAIEEARKELQKVVSGNEEEKAKIEENRKARLDDIESAFNKSVNDPDYARKLYLIEHCIYGVDIQPIATQISKLRFFISLVVDQKPTKDAKSNFGIRPLPNLEAKFVTANTLIPLDRTRNLFTATDEVQYYEELLQDINHRIFLAKKNKDKENLRQLMLNTRMQMAQTMENLGAIGSKGYNQLMGWNMFDQNASAPFFDPEWMFGVKGGFDIVIANPPYVLIDKQVFYKLYSNNYHYQEGKIDLYRLFIEEGLSLAKDNGVMTYITPNTFLTIANCTKLRKFILSNASFGFINNYDDSIFDASVNSVVFSLLVGKKFSNIPVNLYSENVIKHLELDCNQIRVSKGFEININADDSACAIRAKMENLSTALGFMDGIEMCLGMQPYHNTLHTKEQMKSKFLHSSFKVNENYVQDFGGKHFTKYILDKESDKWVDYSAEFYTKPDIRFFIGPRIVVREIPSDTLICAYIEKFALFNKSVFNIRCTNNEYPTKYLLAIMNSKAIGYYIQAFGDKSKQNLFPRISMKILKQLPIPRVNVVITNSIVELIDTIITLKQNTNNSDIQETKLNNIVYHLYNLTYDEVLVIDPVTPITREEYDNFKID